MRFTTEGHGLNSEPQNIEWRMTNDEGWNRFAKSFLKQTEYIHSTFDVHQFLSRSDWLSFWPEAPLVWNYMEWRMKIDDWRMMESLREIFFKTDRIHLFDVRCWTFDVHQFLFRSRLAAFQASGGACMKLGQNGTVSFSIWPAVFLAGGWADTWHLKPYSQCPIFVQSRDS